MLSRCGDVEIKPNIDRAVSAAQSGRGHRSPWDGPVHCRVPHRRQYRDRVKLPYNRRAARRGWVRAARPGGRIERRKEAGGARSLARAAAWLGRVGPARPHCVAAARCYSWDGIHFREEVTLCLNHGLAAALSSQSPSGET